MPGIAVRAEQMPRSNRSWVPPPRCGDATRLTLRLVVNSFVPYAEVLSKKDATYISSTLSAVGWNVEGGPRLV